MNPGHAVDLVHAPLAHWAQTRADATAIRCGENRLSFAQLQQRLLQRAAALSDWQAPATVLVDGSLPACDRLVEFLGIAASGRCAAVGDPDWPLPVREKVLAGLQQVGALADAQLCEPVGAPHPETPFYIGYTSGSSGTPKGYRRHHRSWVESFRICLQTFGADAGGCILAPGRDSHSLFLFGMLLGLWSGGGVELQEQFSASAALSILRSGRTPCLVAVPSQLLMMLEAARHQRAAPIAPVRLILVSGSRWMRHRTPELRVLFPQARIIEFYGASETSFIAWMDTDEQAPPNVVGWPFANVELRIDAPDPVDGAGLIYVRSPMLFMDYVGGAEDATAAIRDRGGDGKSDGKSNGDWLSVRDVGVLDAQGRLCLAGRQNRMLVTLGKNLFPEEVEEVLERHPAIATASVHGVADAVRGLQVVAIIRWTPDAADVADDVDDVGAAYAIDAAAMANGRPTALALKRWCRQHLEGFKTPRSFLLSADWCWTTSGKTDHRALGRRLTSAAMGQAASSAYSSSASATAMDTPTSPSPCLTTLP
jgi:acyl-CoA synthetase (AMP-forming)/AMP-acid ligase II